MIKKSDRAKINELMKQEKPNLVIELRFNNIIIRSDGEYDKDEMKKLRSMLVALAKHITIDRTYVQFRGRRFKDAFILEDGWYKFIHLLLRTDFGHKCTELEDEEIYDTLLTLGITYLSRMIEHLGYDSDHIEFKFGKNCHMIANYTLDERTEWYY